MESKNDDNLSIQEDDKNCFDRAVQGHNQKQLFATLYEKIMNKQREHMLFLDKIHTTLNENATVNRKVLEENNYEVPLVAREKSHMYEGRVTVGICRQMSQNQNEFERVKGTCK